MKYTLPALLLILLVAAGCQKSTGASGTTTTGSGIPINSKSDLNPDTIATPKALLEMAGMKTTVEVKEAKKDDVITVDLVAHGTVFETEKYKSTDDGFYLLEAAGERYAPPIELIKYGMHVGDTWDWTGEMVAGDVPHKTKGKVTSTTETLYIGGVAVHDVVRVDLELNIESGIDKPAVRKMSFWLAKDKGVVKRAVVNGSTREPLEP